MLVLLLSGTYNQNMMDDEQECSKCTDVKANSYTTDLGADHADECSGDALTQAMTLIQQH